MAALDAGAGWLEPNEVGDSQYVCCVFSAIYWPASVSNWCDSCSLLGERRHDIPSPRSTSGLGGGITDPYFMKYLLRVCLSALPTIARCPPGSYGKLHGQFCLIHLTDHLLSFFCSFLPCWLYSGLGWIRLGFTSKVS